MKKAETLTIRITPMSGSTATITVPVGKLAAAEDTSRWIAISDEAWGLIDPDEVYGLDYLEEISEMLHAWLTWENW